MDSAAYLHVWTYRRNLSNRLFRVLTEPCREKSQTFSYRAFNQSERPLWQLINEQPMHLLNPKFTNWQEQLLEPIDSLLADLERSNIAPTDYRWGSYNRVQIVHPLSGLFPFLAEWLNMPTKSMSGDTTTPRYQEGAFGASQRMVVAPGREQEGFFHMPGGQSGNPMSPFYRKGHEDWVEGRPSPFLPGPDAYQLLLRPSP